MKATSSYEFSLFTDINQADNQRRDAKARKRLQSMEHIAAIKRFHFILSFSHMPLRTSKELGKQ